MTIDTQYLVQLTAVEEDIWCWLAGRFLSAVPGQRRHIRQSPIKRTLPANVQYKKCGKKSESLLLPHPCPILDTFDAIILIVGLDSPAAASLEK